MRIGESEWISFALVGATPSGKTKIWNVVLKDQSLIGGQIRWWGAWRKYAFFPKENTLYEEDCLRTIALFCEERTHEHRENRTVNNFPLPHSASER